MVQLVWWGARGGGEVGGRRGGLPGRGHASATGTEAHELRGVQRSAPSRFILGIFTAARIEAPTGQGNHGVGVL